MAIQTQFIKITGENHAVDRTVTEATWQASPGVLRFVLSGSSAGEKFTRADIKELFDMERAEWDADPTNRSTLLYYDEINNRICINLLAWASNNMPEVKTVDGGGYIEGIYLRQCVLSRTEIANVDTFGTIIDSNGDTIYLVDYRVINVVSGGDTNATNTPSRQQQSLAVATHEPDSNEGDAHAVFNDNPIVRVFNGAAVVIWRNGDKLSGVGGFLEKFVRFQWRPSLVYFSGPGYYTYCGYLRPTKTVLTPTVGVIESMYAGIPTSEAPIQGRDEGGVHSISLDGGNAIGLFERVETPTTALTKVPADAYMPNTGQEDVFGLIAGNKSVNATFWIPTLHGATATTSTGAVARFSTLLYNSYTTNQSTLGGFSVTGAVSGLDEFTTDDKHSVCMIIKKVDGSIKYSWSTEALSLKLLYAPKFLTLNRGKSSSPVFAEILVRDSKNGEHAGLTLDISNICDDFHLDYAGLGSHGLDIDNPYWITRYSSGSYYSNVYAYSYGNYVAMLGKNGDVDYISSGYSVDVLTKTTEKVLFGRTDLQYVSSISAVYPTSG